MGWVRKVRYQSGGMGWQARWRDPAGVERAKNFTRKIDAERYLISLEFDKFRGRYADPRLGRTRLADWLTEWQFTRTNLSPATRLRDEASVRKHMIRELGKVPIGQIQPVHVAQWRRRSAGQWFGTGDRVQGQPTARDCPVRRR